MSVSYDSFNHHKLFKNYLNSVPLIYLCFLFINLYRGIIYIYIYIYINCSFIINLATDSCLLSLGFYFWLLILLSYDGVLYFHF